MPTLVIAIPAWGAHYVDLATRYAIPSLLAALNGREAKFIIYTTARQQFSVMDGYDVEFRTVAAGKPHAAQAAAHRDTIATAPVGSVVMLMNADVVVSSNVFDEAERLMAGDVRCISALGLRCLIRKSEPPISVNPGALLAWSWENRHPINEDCVWGRGRTGTPTLLFFEKAGSVTANCFHLHPIFIKKDRPPSFVGTIDNDMLAQYAPHEIYTVRNGEMAFAELSPASKMFARTGPLSIDRVVKFGAGRFTPEHIRSFGQSIRIIGDGPVDDSPVEIIAKRISEWKGPPPTLRQPFIRRHKGR